MVLRLRRTATMPQLVYRILVLVVVGTVFICAANATDLEKKELFAKRMQSVLEAEGLLEPLVDGFKSAQPLVVDLISRHRNVPRQQIAQVTASFFEEEGIRHAALAPFLQPLVTEALTEIESWSGSPATARIREALRTYRPGANPVRVEVDPVRRELLLRWIKSTYQSHRLTAVHRTWIELSGHLLRSLDASDLGGEDPVFAAARLPHVGDHQLMESFFAAALNSVSDEDVADYLGFSESREGRHFFGAIALSSSLGGFEWRDALLAFVQQHFPKLERERVQAAGSPGVAELVSEAKRLLHEVASGPATGSARSLLLQAASLNPNDAEVQTLLGEAAIYSNNAISFSSGQRRLDRALAHFSLADAERHLERAIELDAGSAAPYVLLGYAKFQQHRDDEAETLFRTAESLNPAEPWLAVNQADLSAERGDFERATTLYRRAISEPNARANLHLFALRRLRLVMESLDTLEDFTGIVESYLNEYPEAHAVRLDFVDHLLTMADESRALWMLAQLPQSESSSRQKQLHAEALALRASSSAKEPHSEAAGLAADLEAALALVDGDRERLAKGLCQRTSTVPAAALLTETGPKDLALASTVMGCAGLHGDLAAVDQMLRAGADIEAAVAPFGESLLATSVFLNRPKLFKFLLERGADLHRPVSGGRSLTEVIESKKSAEKAQFRMVLSGARSTTQ